MSIKFVQCNHDSAICFGKNFHMALAVLADGILELSRGIREETWLVYYFQQQTNAMMQL
jgi:hypothetical protein